MWGDWMTIGEGLLEGRRWAMQAAGTNKPEGKGYVTSFGEWLTRWKVHDMDKSDRAKLLQLMEERPAVEEWRATLTDHDRRMLNHPLIVWRKWTAATRVKKPKSRTAGVSATEHGRAQVIIKQLQARAEQSEARARELEEELQSARSTENATALDETNVCSFCGHDFGPFGDINDETKPLDLFVNDDVNVAVCWDCAKQAYISLENSRRLAKGAKAKAKAKAKAEAKAAAEKTKTETEQPKAE